MLGDETVKNLIDDYSFLTVLDIGSGSGEQSNIFIKNHKVVTKFDNSKSRSFTDKDKNIIIGDFMDYKFSNKYDLIFCCHVLEHQKNPIDFIKKISEICKDQGYIAIIVPPAKREFVGGHLSLYTPALLVYQMVLAGINCKNVAVNNYGYNISAIVKNNKFEINKIELNYDYNDIFKLQEFFPEYIKPSIDGSKIGRISNDFFSDWK